MHAQGIAWVGTRTDRGYVWLHFRGTDGNVRELTARDA